MLEHPDTYAKYYYAFVEKLEEALGIDKSDPAYEDRLDEAFNTISDDIHIDFPCGRPLS